VVDPAATIGELDLADAERSPVIALDEVDLRQLHERPISPLTK